MNLDPGSRMQYPVLFWPVSGMEKSGSGMNISAHISESLVTILGLNTEILLQFSVVGALFDPRI